MPAWKNREAGRRGHERFEMPDQRDENLRDDLENDEPRRASRAELDRVERLTRTATALDAPQPSQSDEESELAAVADELDRLLASRERGVEKRSARHSTRPEASRPRHRRKASRTEERFEHDRLSEVIGTLQKLDRQMQDLADEEGYEGDYAGPPDFVAPPDFVTPRDFAADEQPDVRSQAEDFERPSAPLAADDYAATPPKAARQHPAHRQDEPALETYRDLGRRISALREPEAEAYNKVREELGSLRDALGGYSRGAQEKFGRQNEELRRLSDMIERLRVDRTDDFLAKEFRKEVADLKAMVERVNVEGALQTLERGYAHIVQRLDELSRATVDPRALNSLATRMDEIEEAFAALPRSEHVVVLQDRIAEISERMEELLHRKNLADIEPLRNELQEVRQFVERIDIKGLIEGIDDRMRFVSSRLDDLEQLAREQQGLDIRLSAMEERMPGPEVLNRLQGRLEEIVGMISEDRVHGDAGADFERVDSRLDDIVGRLDRMEQKGPSSIERGSFSTLEERLDTIATKIEAIEQRTSNSAVAQGASAMRGAGVDSTLLTQLQARLNVLSEQLEKPRDTVTTGDLDKLREEIGAMRVSVAAPASTEALENRINELAQAVERGSEGLDERRLEQLGSKVAALAEQLETSSSRAEDMSSVAEALARIEQGLQDTRRDVVDIAQKAAREAVAGRAEGHDADYDDAIEGLQDDLKRILDAAEGSDERTRHTFEGVQAVLSSLTERLEDLERHGAPAAKKTPSFLSRGREDKGATGPVPGAYAGLEPSKSRPAQRVRDRKADFIAAARRAAQAASAEVAQMEADAALSVERAAKSGATGKDRSGWLRSVLKRGKKQEDPTEDQPAQGKPTRTDKRELRSDDPVSVLPDDRPAPDKSQSSSGGRRKALLFAAAAVVLAIGTLQVFKMAIGPGPEGEQVAVNAEKAAPLAPQVVKPEPAASEKVAVEAAGTGATADAVPAPEVNTKTAVTAIPEDEAADDTPVGAIGTAHTAEIPLAAVQPSEPAKAESSPAQLGADLAFAPPEGMSDAFSAGRTGADMLPATLVSNLPPEEIGPMALRSAAASGNAAAEFLVGVKYTEGNGVTADLAKAAQWYQKAADKGLAPAQYRLASLYEKGRGVDRDPVKARDWYLKAAGAGNTKAMHNLAVLYAEGSSGSSDFVEAAKWFEKAAAYGVKDSLFNLGILYGRGLGVEKNLVASYKWFAIAAEQGDRDAAKKRDDVANSMDQASLAEARLAVEKFKVKLPDPVTNKVVTDPEWTDAALGATDASAKIGAGTDQTAMVRKAQMQLNQLGFDTGTPDGQMGPRTRSAIKAFQRSLGLVETGIVDAGLLKELDGQAI